MKEADLSKEPEDKLISSKRFLCCKRKLIINLNLKSLLLQRTRRINAVIWRYDPRGKPEKEKDPQEAWKILSQIFKLDKKVQTLFINSFGRFKHKDQLRITQGMKRLKSLQQIQFRDNIDRTDAELTSLMKNLAKLDRLKSLSFYFFSCDHITNIGLSSFSQSLKRMKFLESISLELLSLSQVTDNGLLKFNNSLNRLKLLEDITLMPICKEMTDLSLAKMNFRRLGVLREISIQVESQQLTDKGLYFLTQSFSGLPNLQCIQLLLFGCPGFSDMSLHYIWEKMNNLPSLQKMTLGFSDCLEITDAGFDDMNETLNSLTSIKEIDFEFYMCPGITDDGLAYFGQALAKLISLESLYISFAECHEITDIGVEEVIGYMNELAHLKDVGIDFERCEGLTDASLKYISQFLKSKTSLKKIFLGISEMENATEEGYDNFNEKIDELRLQRPDLSIDHR